MFCCVKKNGLSFFYFGSYTDLNGRNGALATTIKEA